VVIVDGKKYLSLLGTEQSQGCNADNSSRLPRYARDDGVGRNTCDCHTRSSFV